MSAISNIEACPISEEDLQKMGLNQERFAALDELVKNILIGFLQLDPRFRERAFAMMTYTDLTATRRAAN